MGAGWALGSDGTADLTPGKDYVFTLSGSLMDAFELHVHPSNGARVFINDVARNEYSLDTPGVSISSATIKVRLEDGASAPAGEASALRPGRVTWSVGLGSLKNGHAAGVLSLREPGLTTGVYTPDALIYDSADVEVHRIIVSGHLKQIDANQCLVNLAELISGVSYEIQFYGRAQIDYDHPNPDDTYNPKSGAVPFVTYRVENPNPPATNKLRITKTATLGGTRSWWTELQDNTSYWQVIDWTNTPVGTVGVSQSHWTHSGSSEFVDIQDSAGTTVARTEKIHDTFAWGSELIYEIVGSGSANPLTTYYAYHGDPSLVGNYSKLYSVGRPDGSWVRYEYYDDLETRGQIFRTYKPYLDSPAAPIYATVSSGEVTEYTYTADWTGKKTLPATIQTKINGVLAGQTSFSYVYVTVNGRPALVTTRKDYSDASSYLTTVTTTYREDADPTGHYYPGLTHSVRKPDGTMDVNIYLTGIYNPSLRTFVPVAGASEHQIMTLHGTTNPTGAVSFPTWGDSYQADDTDPSFYLVAGKSTGDVLVYAADGTLVWRETMIYTGSGWQTVDRTLTTYNLGIYPFTSSKDSGYPLNTWTVQENTWVGSQLDTTRDAQGILKSFTYDAGGRLTLQKQSAVAGQPWTGDLWTLSTYDAAGHVLSTRRQTSATSGSGDIVSSATYDTAGRVTSSSTPGESGALTTSYTYPGIRQTQIQYPNGGTKIIDTFPDGRLKSITGTAQVPQYQFYAIEGAGNGYVQTSRTLVSTYGTHGDGWSEKRTDWLGRTIFDTAALWAGSGYNVWSYYNSGGQLIRRQSYNASWTTLLAPTVYDYDSMGQLSREGSDLNENGSLEAVSNDRISLHNTYFYNDGVDWWARTDNSFHPDANNAATSVGSMTLVRLTGRTATLQGETRVFDANGNVTRTLTQVDRANAKVTTETYAPGSTTTARTININGFTSSSRSATGATTTFAYDGYGRLTTTQGHDSVQATKVYYAGTDLVSNIRDAVFNPGVIGSEWQEFHYDGAGRLINQRINNLGTWQSTRYEYNTLNLVTRQWGESTMPVEYEYNAYGQRTVMRTYRGGSGWTGSTWPTGTTGTADVTTWRYQGATGLLYEKEDARGKKVTYTYDGMNRLATRTWARGTVTTYGYETTTSGYRTGELKSISYSDGTPTVTYYRDDWSGVYSRTGQVRRVLDATGWRGLDYRANDQQLASEYFDGVFYSGRWLTYAYDPTLPGRPTGFALNTTSSTIEQQTTYGYDGGTGRINTITAGGPVSQTFTYGYHANSDLIDSVMSGSFNRTTYRQSTRDVTDVVETQWSGASKAYFSYGYDWVNQRTSKTTRGELANQLGQTYGLQVAYDHNQRGELEYADAHALDASYAPTGADLLDHYRDWHYDNAGNRATAASVRTGSNYTASETNRYDAIGLESLAYDDDGNIVNDATWHYTYDGENRLKSMETQPTFGSTSTRQWKRLDFIYDYLGRRVEKRVQSAPTPLTGSGLKGEYFAGTAWSGAPLVTRLDAAVNFNWGAGSPGGSVPVDNFSARWTGKIIVPSSGTWTFYALTDDCARLWIDGVCYLDDGYYHGVETSCTLNLSAGEHDIRLEMYEGVGGAAAYLSWAGPGLTKALIDPAYLKPHTGLTGVGLKGQYFSGVSWSGEPTLTRTDSTVDFAWVYGSPGAGVGADNFSARWTGKVTVPTTGTWTFYTTTDDGAHLWIDGTLGINDNTYHGDLENSYSVYLTAGEHDIQMEQFEGGGGATARLSWAGPAMSKQIIPRWYLHSDAVGWSSFPTDQRTRYLYQGWNLIAELDGNAPATVLRTYYWGLELDGTVGGTGGVGGLLLSREASTGATYLPLYDANGNVHGLLDSGGTIVASYDYGPFGETLQRKGSYTTNPFGYSTKYTDAETGFIYYGQRYYNPETGRFINRDPSEESGGLNLYGFCGNNGVDRWDYLGMDWDTIDDILQFHAEEAGEVTYNPTRHRWYGGRNPEGSDLSAESAMAFMAQDWGHARYEDARIAIKKRSTSSTNPNASTADSPTKGSGGDWNHTGPDGKEYYTPYIAIPIDLASDSWSTSTVGDPGTFESLIPIWGAGRSAINDFQNGRWGWGTVNAALAISDVFLVKAIAVAGTKLIVRGAAKLLAREAAETVEARGGTYLLRDAETGQVMRTGRTNDLARRAAEHGRDPVLRDFEFEPVHRTDVYNEQRGLEQLLHDTYNPPLNKVRPISPTNPKLPIYQDAADAFLGN